MRNIINQIKDFNKLCHPKHSYTVILVIIKSIMYILELVEIGVAAIFVEKLTQGNFKDAYIFLAISLIIILFNNVINRICYHLHPKSIGYAYNNIQIKLLNKFKNITDKNFEIHSKEKILNTFHRDGWIVGDFYHTLAVNIAKTVKVIVAFLSILYINYYIAILVIIVVVVNYFIYKKLTNKYIEKSKIVAKGRDTLQEKFSKIIDTRTSLNELDAYHKIDKEYEKANKEFVDNVIKENMASYNIDMNYLSYNKIIIFAISCFLVYLVIYGSFSISQYLMMVGYLVSFITITNEVMSIFKTIKTTNISVSRINTILEFEEYEFIEYGNNKSDDIDGSITFQNVVIDQYDNLDIGKLSNTNIHITNNDTTLLYGQKHSGKRLLFLSLIRKIKPNQGKILIDDIDIYQFDEKTYHSNVAYVTYKPIFFQGSILQNLKMVNKDKNEIIKVCEQLGIHKAIQKLPHKYNENIEKSSYITPELKYLISLARGLLTKSEIIILYEFPISLNNKEKENIKKVLQKIRYTKTILIFSASEQCFDLTDNIIKVERGKCCYLKNK